MLVCEVEFQVAGEAEQFGVRHGGGVARLAQGGRDPIPVRRRKGREPLLFQRQALVAGEAVEALEVNQRGTCARAGERREGLTEEGVDARAGVGWHEVARNQASEAGRGGERGKIAAKCGVARKKAVFADEPRPIGGGVTPALEGERQAVEQVG